MTLSLNKRSLLLAALAGTLALAACDNGSDLGPANAPPPPVTPPLKLSTLINTLFMTATNDTAIPMEIDNVAIDTDSSDLTAPNSDPLYSALVGT